VTLSRRATDMDEDDRKALAQALHEKVIYYYLNVALFI